MFKMKLDLNAKLFERKLQIAKTYNGGLHSTIRWTLLCSRVMGLLPLSGLSHPTSDRLRFTLNSPYTVLYVFSIFGQFLMFSLSIFWLIQKGFSLSNFTNSLFYSSSLTSSIILVNIGRYWPRVMMRVEELEAHLPPFTRDVAKLCNVTMICILLAAMVEHLTSVTYGMAVAYSCADNYLNIETYFQYSLPWIFEYTSYTWWKGVLSEIFNIQSTFIWSFNDLLVIVISIYLTQHFIEHHELLKNAVNQEYFPADTFRIQYLKIVRLLKLINGQVGIYILISFGSNLYWICTQLFYSLNNTYTGHFIACRDYNLNNRTYHGVEHIVYFTFSFSFLVARTLLVLLLAARIHSNSNVPLAVLHGLPTEKFDVEVERFIAQIKNIKVALSGLDFFYVTRTMILTLLGTIITYELVLLQFNR